MPPLSLFCKGGGVECSRQNPPGTAEKKRKKKKKLGCFSGVRLGRGIGAKPRKRTEVPELWRAGTKPWVGAGSLAKEHWSVEE